ncbi:MAG: hypothetical protein ACOC12_07230, partial [Bacteroidota bacterium]
MKRLTIYTVGIMLLFNAGVLYAENETETSTSDFSLEAVQVIDDVKAADTDYLVERIEYINEMDKSDLGSTEKRELRQEV